MSEKPSEQVRELVGALDSVLTMPIVRISPHAKKLGAIRAWVLDVDARLSVIEQREREREGVR
jgi:hypothetical protein